MDEARSPDGGGDEAPRPQLLWRSAARVGSLLAVAVAACLETGARFRRRELPRPMTDLERARRARAAHLLPRRARDHLED